MPKHLRVALFTDSYPETNGVGTFSREFARFARENARPFLVVYGGTRTGLRRDGSLTEIELRRGPATFPLDRDLACDPAIYRHRNIVLRAVKDFQPHLVQFTGPGDISIMGLWMSNLAGVPATGSWHTNVHEYAERRVESLLRHWPEPWRKSLARGAGAGTWAITKNFYRVAHFLSSPNEDMRQTLQRETGRPCFRMGHGVDPARFHPQRRQREGGEFVIGYVGRLTPEKNVRYFAELERNLEQAGAATFRLLLIGDGYERTWLEQNLRHATLPGILRGDALADAFASMDAFLFPSQTDTFGLVILEAMASGVPVVCGPETAAKAGVEHGITGMVGEDLANQVLALMRCCPTRHRLAAHARQHACAVSWPRVFEELYGLYAEALETQEVRRRWPTPTFERTLD
jgi:glycosyltransferase involved in cell wall biosynthesis